MALVLPSAASAGTYKVEVCTPNSNNSLSGIATSSGTEGFLFNEDCSQHTDSTPTVGFIRLRARVEGSSRPVKGTFGWFLEAPLNTAVTEVEFDRSFSRPWDQRFEWGLLGSSLLESHSSGEAPPEEHVHYMGFKAGNVEGALQCRPASGCAGNAGETLAEVTVKNIFATLEDDSPPEITITPPDPMKPLRGTVTIPYEAKDKGSGVRTAVLLNDFVRGTSAVSIDDEDHDLNEGKCVRTYKVMVPCKLKINSSFSLDTTQLSDGPHTITAVDADAGEAEGETQAFQIVVHNAPTNTTRPALAGTAKVGEKLSATSGAWEGSSITFAYQWLRCAPGVADNSEAGCEAIPGATGATYNPTAPDADKRLVAKVTATNTKGAEAALTPPSGPVAEKPGGGKERHEEESHQGNALQTKLAKHPRKKTTMRKAKFTFTSDQPGVHFECKLDKAAFKPCRSPYKRKVKPGRHSFQVRAVNPAGIADPTPAVYRWRVSSR
jgi:hypothetical protein